MTNQFSNFSRIHFKVSLTHFARVLACILASNYHNIIHVIFYSYSSVNFLTFLIFFLLTTIVINSTLLGIDFFLKQCPNCPLVHRVSLTDLCLLSVNLVSSSFLQVVSTYCVCIPFIHCMCPHLLCGSGNYISIYIFVYVFA